MTSDPNAPFQSSKSLTAKPAIPIVLGVVGHRDLLDSDVPALESALERVILEFRAAYQHSPLVMMSSLAQGADTLAARVAQRCGVAIRRRCRCPNVNTVKAPRSIRKCIDKSSTSFGMMNLLRNFKFPCRQRPANRRAAGGAWRRARAKRKKEYRSSAYANAAAFLVMHSHVLIAFWDGDDSNPIRPSGTAEHVLMKLVGRRHSHLPNSLEEPLGYRGERGPVIVINTPRARSARPEARGSVAGGRDVRTPITVLNNDKALPAPQTEVHSLGDVRIAGRVHWRRFFQRVRTSLGVSLPARRNDPNALAWREVHQFQNICQAVDDFNREAAAIPEDRWKTRSDNISSATRLFEKEPMATWGRRISAVREAAAELANPLGRQLDLIQRWMFLVIGLSLLCFHLYAHPLDLSLNNRDRHPWIFLALSLALLAATMAVVVRNWYQRLDERRLDYRVLAEAFRVRLMWSLAGLDQSVAAAYPGQLRGEVAWVRQALRIMCPPSPLWKEWFNGLAIDQQLECLRTVKEDWLRDQKQYHIGSHENEHWWLARFRAGGFVLALLGWCGLTFMLFGESAEPLHLLLLACSMSVVVGGLLIAFCERRAHEELSKHYERMSLVFDAGLREFEDCLDRQSIRNAQHILEALGREAVAENASWVILRRSRPLELHIGG